VEVGKLSMVHQSDVQGGKHTHDKYFTDFPNGKFEPVHLDCSVADHQ
jgi:hypothetical protein